MNRKVLFTLEMVWLTIAVISFGAGLYNWYELGFGESIMFFVITLLSLMMYFFRRNLRKSQKS